MKLYNHTKTSSLKWLGDIPGHWDLMPLKYLFQIYSGATPQSGMEEYWNGNTVWITPADFKTKDHYIYKGSRNITQEGLSSCSTTLIPVGTVAINKVKLCTNQGCLACIPRKIASSEFFYYIIGICTKVFESWSEGTTFKEISLTAFKKFPMPVPPREEQDQIARFLDWKVSGVNKLINIEKRKIEKLKELRQSIVSQTVTRGLNPNVTMKDSGVKWLGEIPTHWEMKKLRKIMKIVSVKNQPNLPLLSVVREKGVILRDIKDRQANHNFIPDDLRNYKVVKVGQFVINKMKAWQGSYGVSTYTGIVSPAYFVFDLAFENIEYFHYAVRSKIFVNFFAQASDGIRVGQWDLQMEKIKEISIPVPPLEEQDQIVRFLDGKVSGIDKLIDVGERKLEKLQEMKNRLISDVVTGKIDVRSEEIPTYEHVEEEADIEGEAEGEEATDE